MDIIYTDQALQDVGVLKNCQIDMAYGSDENDFELIVEKNRFDELGVGSLIYIDDTEYGGIIDTIESSSTDDVVKFGGDTFTGLLNNKIIEPEGDYRYLYGDANEVLAQLIILCSLTDVFVASEEVSGYDIIAYKVDRYNTCYKTIIKMLNSVGAKLKIKWNGEFAELSAVPYIDYSQDDEFSQQLVEFSMRKDYKPVNHLICLGKGELNKRAVVHLFTDEHGTVQPFTFVNEPYTDEQYILDKSQQVLFDYDEVAEVYDYPSAEIKENFILLESQPSDWNNNYKSYFVKNENNFESVTDIENDIYTSLTSQPSDWNSRYSNYYKFVDGVYQSVEGVEIENYTKLTSKPSDWNNNYKNYYLYVSDGVTYHFESVVADSKKYYTIQTLKPTDWEDNFSKYYTKSKQGKYVSVSAAAPSWRKNTYYIKKGSEYTLTTKMPTNWNTKFDEYYTRSATYSKNTSQTFTKGKIFKKVGTSYSSVKNKPSDWNKSYKTYFTRNESFSKVKSELAPTWVANKYYTQFSKDVVPKYDDDRTYFMEVTTEAPTWVYGGFYSKSHTLIRPSFCSNTYYKKFYNRLEQLIDGGLEKLNEYWSADEINVILEEGHQYDIGDFIGAIEDVTGLFVRRQITKKIININTANEITTTYEVGII